ncbi:uncharacterized protein LOC131636037 [Vicia villosa]|uniref:uncharacterized protein LOC131636037 n=1 Tax=Vicia villosa TaxID=3911 RepID=UPI00273AEEC5|nr:uncharacterized protein LOC131636037 [Vicia villosa]XP_058762664.1 uncharacterized protein LOC131636037 [Vicia villosa]XP_058762666.1 uncharacterized protein LOC131636037 [Vicia villosa]
MSRKVYGESKSGKSSMPNAADYHQEIHKNEEDIALKSYRSRHKHGNHGREYEDEMVKYMSNLPGYLQRGREESREKVLNVGVLDWNRLEQWKNNRKDASHRNRRSSSSNNDSSSVLKDGLSGHSSKDQGTILRQSLKSHFMASSIQDHSQAVKSSRRSIGHCQDFRGSIGNIDTKDHPNRRLKEFNREYLDPHIDKESGIMRNEKLHKAASSAMLEMRTRDSGTGKRVEKLNEPNIDNVVQSMLRKREPFVHNLPTKSEDHSLSFLAQKSEDHTRLSFSEQPKEFFRKELNHDISHSGSLPDELSCNDSQDKGSACSSTDLESFKLPASTFSSPASTPSSPLSVRVELSPPKSRKAEEMKQTTAKISSANVPLHEVDQKVTSEKSRSSSPFRQSSIGYSSRGSACKETGHVRHQSSITAAECNANNVRGCDNLNISGNDKPGDAGRSRTSPLRRLLDPLLKPKTAKFSHSLDSSQKDSLSTNKNYRSANARFSTLHPIKEVDRDHKAGYSAVMNVDSSRDKKHAPSMIQALLRIAVKNGLPLFTFAVNQIDGNILAAKVKNLGGGSGKEECNRIYTFLTFSEVKKKNGSWMSKAARSKEPDYVPQVVAQMKASDLHYDLTGQNCMDSSTMKEFVLFSVKLGQGDAQDADYQPNDELAAIAVKIPKAISFVNNQHHSSFHRDSHDVVQATVVLPGGVHSFPSKGGPSSLLERWKSGGSCDCGGWDLACKLKILASENQASKKSRSSKPYFADYQFDLFVQGNEQDPRPAFSLTPLENGMSSVAFDSSLSLLQAFAICIALVDSKMPCELSGSRNSIEGKNTLSSQTEELKAFGKLEDIPTSYVSNPPVSPVGRV